MSEAPQRSRARLLGIVYFLYFVTTVSGGLLVKGLAVHGDAVATAHNFAVHEVAVRSGSAIGLVSLAFYLALTALFYELLRPVSRRVSLLATLFSVTACAIQALGDVFLAPLQVLAGSQGAYGAEVSRYLAHASLAMHVQALHLALVLFGGFDILIGNPDRSVGLSARYFRCDDGACRHRLADLSMAPTCGQAVSGCAASRVSW